MSSCAQSYGFPHLHSHDVSLLPSVTAYISMSKLHHRHNQKLLVGWRMWFFCASLRLIFWWCRMWVKWVEVTINVQSTEASFPFVTDRTSSEPVEDTDTTSFVTEFVSTFHLFLPPVMSLLSTCLLSSLFCADFLLFFLRLQSLKVIC